MHPDDPLRGSVLQRAGVEQQLHGARDVRRRSAIGPSQKAVALETGDVTTDGHLGYAELAGELGDVDRLVLGHLLEDPMAAVNG